MTPSENPEAPGSNGTPASPPWQRVGKDGDSEATVKLATDEALYKPEPAAERDPAGLRRSSAQWSPAARRLACSAEVETPHRAASPPRPPSRRHRRSGPGRALCGARAAARAGQSLQVKRFDPWSVLKLSLVLGVAMFFVWLVAVGVLYTVLDGMGVWDKLNGTYSSLVGGEGANASAEPLISAGRVFGIAAILGAINIVLVSALATVSAFIYNVSADLAGGLEVTLSERE